MEKITTKSELIEMLESILVFEIKARDSYVNDTNTFNDFKITDTIQRIKTDEDKHIKLLQDLIQFLKN